VVIHTRSNFGSMTHEDGENVHKMGFLLTHFLLEELCNITLTASLKIISEIKQLSDTIAR